jgi:glutamate/tyrosine decarboxylase-like PLP-dependent enzyme
MPDINDLLRHTAEQSIAYLDTVADRPVGRPIASDRLREALGDGPLPKRGEDPRTVVDALVAGANPGLVASAGPRYFGFVIGGSLPAALAADWLTSAWDQNAFSYVSSPAASVIEEIAGRWVRDVLGLPVGASVGFTTGATTSNMVGLAAARNAVLARAGWDVEANGLIGAPPIRILVGEEVHASALRALRFVGLGSDIAERIPVDGQGAIRADAAETMLAGTVGPAIVLAQAGNVNSGAVDPLGSIADAAHAVGAWVHVDGAFGLWAAASPTYRHLLAGVDRVDSWAMDCHKWLNVPYDCGFVAVADRVAHYGAGRMTAAYLVPAPDDELDPYQWVPEASRRGRATPVYAALRSLGRDGVADLVDRCCALARRMGDHLGGEPGIAILNDVVLNQVLVRFDDDDERTRAVIAAVQEDGTCWAGGTTWHGLAAMRISVSGWPTTEDDIDRSAEAIVRCFRGVRQDG